MAQVPLSQAAKLVGVSRASLYRYVKTGKLSVTLAPDPSRTGQPNATEGFIKTVDTAELERVFGPLTGKPETPRDSPLRPSTTAVETAVLQAELASTRAALAEAKEREARLLDLLASQSRLLEHRQAEADPEPEAPKESPWFLRMLGL